VSVPIDPEVFIQQLSRIGFVVRDTGLLLSALGRPHTTLFGRDAYPTLPLQTAALMDSIVNNHPMVDGNKRSSWFAANLFVELNRFEFVVSQDEAFTLILDVATGDNDLEHLAEWIERRLRAIDSS
jgi:death-on-curing protein